MLTNLVSLLTKSLSSTNGLNKVAKATPKSNNPFAQNTNSFLSTSYATSDSYGKNQPVQGGYFAGYYNGKPNIVGRKLFIEI